MSLNDTRAAFRAALDTVAGVKGYTSRPSAPRPGDAWPVWQGAPRDRTSGLFDHTWAVGVLLPQEEKTADDWIDSHLADLVKALSPVAYVDAVQPANFGPESSPQLGLLITTRE